jgi:WD40 repeat protein/cytochrome c-type biogenesis protein CcmH/NrfG
MPDDRLHSLPTQSQDPPTADPPTIGMPAGGAAPVVDLPGYEILGEIGRGGMGVVYKARQIALERVVAVKMILAGAHASPNAVARFQNEALTIARLQHPNIVQVHEVGSHAGHSYLVLEYVEGGTLAARTAGVLQPPREAARLVETLARAVAFAHDSGVVHRDLKPANVLLTSGGVPRITDFGLAAEIQPQQNHLTATGTVIGTPGYMSPEQAGGQGAHVGPSTDVWALGAILYALLTGRPPFQASTPVETILQTLGDDPAPPSRLTRKVPRDLDTVCLKCLRKEPAQRYASAGELADDLRRFLADQPVHARPAGRIERLARWARRHPGVAGLLAAVQMALVALVVLGVWSNFRIAHELRRAESARDEAVLARDEADRLRSDAETARDEAESARTQAEKSRALAEKTRKQAELSRDDAVAESYRARFSETQALRLAGQSGWRHLALAKLHELAALSTPQRDPVALRSEAAACVGGFDAVLVQRFAGHAQSVRSLDFSPDGALLASHDPQRLYLWDVTEGRHVRTWIDGRFQADRVIKRASPRPCVRFRPGKHTMAVTTWSGSVSQFDPDSGALPTTVRGGGNAYARCLAYGCEGQLLAVSWTDGRISLHAAGSGALRRVIRVTPAPASEFPVAVSPDGRWVASGGDEVRVWLHSAGGLAPSVVLGRHRDTVRGVAFSPDGKVVASCSSDQTIRLTPIDAPQEATSLIGHTSRVTAIAFSPDGSLLASVGEDGGLRLWEARSGQQLADLRPNAGALRALAFSPDGSHVAVSSNDVFVYRLSSRRERRRLHGHRYVINAVAFHPSKPLLASGSADRSVHLWQLPEGKIVRSFLQSRSHPVRRLAFSPDGKVLACGVGQFVGRTGGEFGIDLIDAETGKPLARLEGPTQPIRALAFSPDGKRLAAGGDGGEAFVWDVPTHKLLHSSTAGSYVSGLTFASEDELIMSAWGGGIFRQSISDGKAPRRAAGLTFVNSHAVSKGLVAAGAPDGSIHLLHLRDLTTAGGALKGGHDGSPTALAFSPDGRLLASGGRHAGGYCTALWDVRRRELLLRIPSPNSILSLAFDRDGLQLAIAGVEEQVTLWDLALLRPELAALGLDWDGRGRKPRPVAPAPTVQVVKAPAVAPAAAPRRPGREADHLRLLEDRSRRDPNDKDVLLALAQAHREQGNYADASGDCEKHLKLCKDCAVALCRQGEALLAQGKRAEAEKVYQRCQAAHPTHAEACHRLAWLYAQDEKPDLEQALLLARRAAALAPTDVRASLTLAFVYLRSGQDEQAVQVLEKMPAGKTLTHSLGRLHLAGCLARLGKQAEAGRAFDEAAAWWHDPAAHPHAVTTWLATRKEAAAALGRPAAPPAPTLAERAARGRALARMGKWEQARDDLEEAVKGRPQDAVALELAGRACALTGDHDRAAVLLGRALDRLKPADAAPLHTDVARWPRTFERLAEARPEEWQLHLARGRRLVRLGEWKEAEGHYAAVPAKVFIDALLVERAALLLLLGEQEKYERLIAARPDPGEKETSSMLWLVWAASLGRKPGATKERLKALLDRIGEVRAPRQAHAVGMARLRLGQKEEVVKAVTALPPDRQDTAGLNLFLLALARKAQKSDEAGKAAGQAQDWLAARRPKSGEPASMLTVDWLTLELMRREVEGE